MTIAPSADNSAVSRLKSSVPIPLLYGVGQPHNCYGNCAYCCHYHGQTTQPQTPRREHQASLPAWPHHCQFQQMPALVLITPLQFNCLKSGQTTSTNGTHVQRLLPSRQNRWSDFSTISGGTAMLSSQSLKVLEWKKYRSANRLREYSYPSNGVATKTL